jgi:hypothetical protein
METFRRAISVIVGAILVLGGVLDECPRVAAVAVGLLLLGAFTAPEALKVVRGSYEEKRREDE